MNKYFQRPIGKSILICCMLLLAYSNDVTAQTFMYSGSEESTIITGDSMYIHGIGTGISDTIITWCKDWDDIWRHPTSWGDSFKLKSNNAFVKFEVNPYFMATDYRKNINYTYRMCYTAYGYTNPADTVSVYTTSHDTLTISFNNLSDNTPFQDQHLRKYSNYYKMMVVINQILIDTGGTLAVLNPTDTAWRNFFVEASILTQHYDRHPYGPSDPPPAIIAAAAPGNNYVDLSWDPYRSVSPVSYELEWTYADNYVGNYPDYIYGSSAEPLSASQVWYDFRNNSTRVWLDSNGYRLPLTYPSGYVVYRIRYVRPDSALYKYPVYGAWSGQGTTSIPDSGYVSSLLLGREYERCEPYTGDSLNWQYTVSFAEGGKYKQVASFYDGLLKNRQSITLFNSLPTNLIVTNNIYDYEGRPAIKTLPAPVNSVLSFSFQHNVDIDSATHQPYEASGFDSGLNVCPINTPIPPFASSALASIYYSPHNPDQSGFQKYVPDAQGYPFVQTIYEPGFTDRVLAQGGAGPRLQIGDTNYISNSYVSPGQQSLNALFGPNIGWSSYYHMTVSSDPNKQLSMVIKDYEGRQMASALIGVIDTATHALTNNGVPPTVFYKQDLLLPNVPNQVIDTLAGTKTAQVSYYNEAAGTDSLNYQYTFTPYEACPGQYIFVKSHYDCWVTDQCGNFLLHNDAVLGNNGVDTSSTPVNYTHDTGFTAVIGAYNVQKVVSFYPNDVSAAVDSFFNVANCYLSENYFIRQSIDTTIFPCPGDTLNNDSSDCQKLEAQMIQQLYPGAIYGSYPYDSLGGSNSIFSIVGCPIDTFTNSYTVDSTACYDYWEEGPLYGSSVYLHSSIYNSSTGEYDSVMTTLGSDPELFLFDYDCIPDSFGIFSNISLRNIEIISNFYQLNTTAEGNFSIATNADFMSLRGDTTYIISASDGTEIASLEIDSADFPLGTRNLSFSITGFPISHGIINSTLLGTLPSGQRVNISMDIGLLRALYPVMLYSDSFVTNIHSPLCHSRYQDTCLVPNLGSITVDSITYGDLRTMPVDSFIMVYNAAIAAGNDSIAMELLPLHPQYCQLKNCFSDTFKTEVTAIPNWQAAASLNLLLMDSIVAHDPLKSLMVSAGICSSIATATDSLRTFSGGTIALDSLVLMNAYCASGDSIMFKQCASQMFAREIAQHLLINDAVKSYYFNNIINLYFSNRQQFVDEIFMSGGTSCSHCAMARMTLDPAGALDLGPVAVNDTTTGGDSVFSDSSVTTLLTGPAAGNPTTLLDSLRPFYNSLDSTLAMGALDTLITHLSNCYGGNPVLAAAIKDTLATLYSSGQVAMGNYSYAQILYALTSNGVALSDLCNPYVINGYQFNSVQPIPVNDCMASGFYTDMGTFLNNATVVGALSNPGSSPVAFSLNTANQYEAKIYAALGSLTGTTLFANYDTATSLYELDVCRPSVDTVRIFLHSSCGEVFSSGGSPSINVSCINSVPSMAIGAGLVNEYSFIATIISGATTCTMTGWGDSVLTMSYRQNSIAQCVPCTQMRTLYTQFADTLASYGVYGADHPYYDELLANYMNYYLQQQYGSNDYETFIQSCALADSVLMPLYNGYATYKFTSTADMNSFISMMDHIDTLYSFDNAYRDSTVTDSAIITISIDLSSVPAAELWAYKNALQSYSGSFHSRIINQPFASTQPTGTIGFIYTSTDPSIPFNPADSGIIDTSTVTFSIPYQKAIWTGGHFVVQTVYDVIAATSTPPYAISKDVYTLSAYLYTHGIPGAVFVPNYKSTVNADYFKPEKQAYLKYVYGLQSLPEYQVLDSIQGQYLSSRIAYYATAGYQASYSQPFNAAAPGNLYLGKASMSNAYYDTLARIVTLAGPGGFIFHNALSTTVSANLHAYICSDGSYWYRYFTTGDTLFNVYVSFPSYIPQYLQSSYKVAGAPVPVPGDSLNRYFLLNLVRSGTTDTIQAYGMTNFVICKSIELDNVLLGKSLSPTIATVTDTFNNCERQVLNSAVLAGVVTYNSYMDSVKSAVAGALVAGILNSSREQLDLGYVNNEFQYTLYNYDRAGNLAFTVPPAGVSLLPNTSLLNGVDTARLLNTPSASPAPVYSKINSYNYNSLNEVANQVTINGGKTRFMYDAAGRLIFSQNARQAPGGLYTYNLYDEQNRIIETGEAKMGCPYFDAYPSTSLPAPGAWCYHAYVTGTTTSYTLGGGDPFITTDYLLSPDPYFVQFLDQIPYDSLSWYIRSYDRDDVVMTIYDTASKNLSTIHGLDGQQNLRKRVSCVKYFEALSLSDPYYSNYTYATHYSYDIDGNVQTLTQDFPALAASKQQYKRIDYDYDLISGKVNMLSYNRGWPDQYYQRYAYDADNRITQVSTSNDGYIWQRDAAYSYYQHGPLARVELGDLKVQGIDYAYTIQGWLKVMNSDIRDSTRDIGGDGLLASVTPKDAVAYAIDYFKNDYHAISGNAVQHVPQPSLELFNGNIVRQTAAIDTFQRLNKQYVYDQLNRIRQAGYASIDPVSATLTGLNDFHNNYAYDADGNIQRLVRYGNKLSGTAQLMDSLLYNYSSGGHDDKLRKLYDYADSVGYTNDIRYTGSAPDVYAYDPTGNTTKDLASGQDTVQWNLYNKVTNTQNNAAGNAMSFKYDGAGNRVSKMVTTFSDTGTTVDIDYYVHDAQGNILAVYKEQDDYGQIPVLAVGSGDVAVRGVMGHAAFNAEFVTPNYGGDAGFEHYLIKASDENPDFAAAQLAQPISYFLKARRAWYNDMLYASPSYMSALITATTDTAGGNLVSSALTVMAGKRDQNFIKLMGGLYNDAPANNELLGQLCNLSNGDSILWSLALTVTDTNDLAVLKCDEMESLILSDSVDGAVMVQQLLFKVLPFYPGSMQQYMNFLSTDTVLLADSAILPAWYALQEAAITGYAPRRKILDFFDSYSGAQQLLGQFATQQDELEVVYHASPGAYIAALDSALGDPYIDTAIVRATSFSMPSYLSSVFRIAGITSSTLASLETIDKYKDFSLAEHDIYGSSRLGIKEYYDQQVGYNVQYNSGTHRFVYSDTTRLWNNVPWYSLEYQDVIKTDSLNLYGNTLTAPYYVQHTLGQQQYELTDHLGDVLATVSDKRANGTFAALPGSSLTAGNPVTVQTWQPLVVSAYDYYPFGQYMPGRYFTDTACHCYTSTITEQVPVAYETWQSIITLLQSGGIKPIRTANWTNNGNSATLTSGAKNSGFNYGISGLRVGAPTGITLDILKMQGNFTASVTDDISGKVLGSIELSNTQGKGTGIPAPPIPGLTPGGMLYTIPFTAASASAHLTVTSIGANTSSLVVTGIEVPHDSMATENVVSLVCNKDHYRYGFNGQMKVNEWAGVGNHYVFKQREQDPRTGRFISVDPITSTYPWYSGYQFAGNSPVLAKDLEGLEPFFGTASTGLMKFFTWITTPTDHYITKQQAELADKDRNGKPLDKRGVIVQASQLDYQQNPIGAIFKDVGSFAGDVIGAGQVDDYVSDLKNGNLSPADATLQLAQIGLNFVGEEPGEGLGEGKIYRRTEPKTGEEYIGKSKNAKTYKNRQTAHDRAKGIEHKYEELESNVPDNKLNEREESHIRKGGGPKNKGGRLQNKRYQMNDAAYKKAGGKEQKPTN